MARIDKFEQKSQIWNFKKICLTGVVLPHAKERMEGQKRRGSSSCSEN